MGYIYKIKNDIDDKLYIGQTVKTINYRFKEHIRTAKNEYKNKKHLTLFHKMIIKYGEEHFSVEELEECENNKLDEREIYWIAFYNSFWDGYNSTTGGQFNPVSKAQMVIQYNSEGEYLHLYKSAVEAAAAVNGNESSIRDACTLGRKTSAGYQWRYYQADFPLQIEAVDLSYCGGGKNKKVIQYDLYGNKINTFPSIEIAAQSTGIKRGNIGRACHDEGTSTAGRYQWRFANSKDIPICLVSKVKEKTIPRTQKSVIQYTKDTHEIIKEWDTIKEAADALNIRSSLIINVCEKQQKSAGKFYWQYKI